MINAIRSVVGGFLIGAAQIVPGVSGGTIALVLGIYERLVASIKEGSSAFGYLLRADWSRANTHLRRVEWRLLILLGIGVVLAIFLLAGFLERQLDENPTILAGLFLGLVVGSIVITWNDIASPTLTQAVIALVVGVAFFLVLGFGEGEVAVAPGLIAYFLAGALASCAMILPGISGSLLLIMVGMYDPALSAVSDFDATSVAALIIGAVVGLALFSQFLNWALQTHHDPVLAALIGLMVGSTRVLWPWPDGVSSPQLGAPGDDWLVVTLAALIGAGIVYLVARLARDKESQVSEPLPS